MKFQLKLTQCRYLECIHIKELGGMITKQMGSAAAATRKNLLNKSMR